MFKDIKIIDRLITEINNKYININNLQTELKGKNLYLISNLNNLKLKIKISLFKFIENMIDIELYSKFILEQKLAVKNKRKIIKNDFEENFDLIVDEEQKLKKLLKIVEIYYKGKNNPEFLLQEIYNVINKKEEILINSIEIENNCIIVKDLTETIKFKYNSNNNSLKIKKNTNNINVKILKDLLNIFIEEEII